MNIQIIKGRVFIKEVASQDEDFPAPDGWHNAGIIKDAIANWPQYADEINAALPAYNAEVEAAEKAEAERARLQEIKEREAAEKAIADRIENERKAKEALQKHIEDAVAAAVAKITTGESNV